MRKYRSAYLKPYIRRKTQKDINYSGCDSRTYLRLCFPWFKYVMVQRGTNHIIACGRSREELKREMLEEENLVFGDNKNFKRWANKIKMWQQEVSLKVRRGNDLSIK